VKVIGWGVYVALTYLAFVKTLSTVENALTLRCVRRTLYANRVSEGSHRKVGSIWIRGGRVYK